MASEDQRKHLEIIQNVITRMGSNSFIIKGWSITAIGAIYAYWLSNQNYAILLLILGVTLMFWFHDAYYLRLERGFRNLYDNVRLQTENEINYDMTPIFTEAKHCSAFRPILMGSYGIVVLITLVLLFIFK